MDEATALALTSPSRRPVRRIQGLSLLRPACLFFRHATYIMCAETRLARTHDGCCASGQFPSIYLSRVRNPPLAHSLMHGAGRRAGPRGGHGVARPLSSCGGCHTRRGRRGKEEQRRVSQLRVEASRPDQAFCCQVRRVVCGGARPLTRTGTVLPCLEFLATVILALCGDARSREPVSYCFACPPLARWVEMTARVQAWHTIYVYMRRNRHGFFSLAPSGCAGNCRAGKSLISSMLIR
jgi:hypothetical protein